MALPDVGDSGEGGQPVALPHHAGGRTKQQPSGGQDRRQRRVSLSIHDSDERESAWR